jgi:hypothetical protein
MVEAVDQMKLRDLVSGTDYERGRVDARRECCATLLDEGGDFGIELRDVKAGREGA